MPKILLIQPTQYGPDRKLCKQRRIYLPGLAFPLLAAMTPNNWEAEVNIEVVDEINYETDADLIGIGTMGFAIYRGAEIAQEFRRRGKPVVMGGYMASMVAREALRKVDCVVVGDAEHSYPQLLRDFERDGKLQPIYDMPVNDLKGLPVPRYDLLIRKPIGDMLPVQAGRGCPHTCSFCSIACLYKGKYLSRPIDEVMRDIQAIRDLGFRKFYLLDDNIVSHPRYLEALCKEIEPLHMSWASQCSLHLAKNPRLLETVVRSGANLMSFGIESITQEGLNKLGKSWLRVEDHAKLISKLTEAGIMVSSEMIVGTDSDTEESIRQTYEFIQQARIAIPRFYILTPMPGSALFDQYKAEGRLESEDFERYNGSECVHRPMKISARRLTEMYWWLNRKVFSWRSILWRTILNPRALRAPILYLTALYVNLHYRKYVMRKVPPNIF